MVKYSHFSDLRADPMFNLLTIHSLFKIQCERNLKLGCTDIFHKLRNVKFVAKSSVLLRIYQDAVNMSSLFVVVQFRGYHQFQPRSVDKNNDQS